MIQHCGPLIKDKASFVVAGRRSYIDLLSKPFLKGDLKESKFNFYDLTAKINYKLDKRNRFYISAYKGRDVFGSGSDFGFDWGNQTMTGRWNHTFNNKLFLNTSFRNTKQVARLILTSCVIKKSSLKRS